MAIPRELLPLSAPPVAAAITSDCCRSVRSRARRHLAVEDWRSDIIHSLNSLYGRGQGLGGTSTSAAQREGLAHIESVIREVGAPTTTPAAAHQELCGARAGYLADPTTHRPFQRGLVSLPALGATARGEDNLSGKALDFWMNWPSKLMRPKSETRLAVRPYTDQSLIRSRQKYAEFVLDLVQCNLVRFGKARPSTLGIFFVAKADKLRLIFDTRKINQEFVAPAYSQLPTTGAWDNLLLKKDQPLCLAQIDVSNVVLPDALPHWPR